MYQKEAAESGVTALGNHSFKRMLRLLVEQRRASSACSYFRERQRHIGKIVCEMTSWIQDDLVRLLDDTGLSDFELSLATTFSGVNSVKGLCDLVNRRI
jgi:hypothetical protein